MALRINHNIAALNALRNLNKTDKALSGNFERLSSGLKVNRAADGPATLVISEQMRGQIASINQAIENSEASISMLQTSEAALTEVNKLMISLRQLAIHAANEGANDDKMLAADQAEIDNALDSIDRIARTSQFGTRTLLDGSNGANGVAVGNGLDFVSAEPITKASPAEGYPINITRAATRAEIRGTRPIEIDDFRSDSPEEQTNGFEITISEGGKNISFSMANKTDSKVINDLLANLELSSDLFSSSESDANVRGIIAQALQQKVINNGLELKVFIDPETDVLVVRHNDFGSEPTFLVSNTVGQVLGGEADRILTAIRGRDVEGTIDNISGVGSGEELTAPENTDADGLKVRFDSVAKIKLRFTRVEETLFSKIINNLPFTDDEQTLVQNSELQDILEDVMDNDFPFDDAELVSREEEGQFVVLTFEAPTDVKDDNEGFVHVTQNSLTFQVGPTRGQQVKISLVDAKTDRLGMGVDNDTGFKSLREIDVTTPQGAQDSLLLIDEAITQISSVRANLGAFQKNTLESNASSLRVAQENLISAESSLRDADIAAEISDLTRNQIMFQASMAMLAQANQSPQAVLQLLGTSAA